MNSMRKMSRRSFIMTSAAAGGGLALGLDIPFGGPHDDSRPGRRTRDQRLGGGQARRHRGHPHRPLRDGARHAHRAMPARRRRARMRLVEGHLGISRRPARTSPASACGATCATGGSRGIRTSHEYVRQGGAVAREMLKQAAADQWKVPVSELTRGQQRDHAQGFEPQHQLRQGGGGCRQAYARRTEIDQAQGPEGLEDRRQAGERGSTPEQDHRQQVYGADLKLPGMLNGAIKDCPVFGGKIKSFDAAKVTGMPGVKHVRQGRRDRRSRWSPTPGGRPSRARGAADRLGRGRERQGVERIDRRVAEGRPRRRRRPSSATRTATSRRPSPARPRRSRRSTPIRTRTTPAWSR